jgi:hypothetical protein
LKKGVVEQTQAEKLQRKKEDGHMHRILGYFGGTIVRPKKTFTRVLSEQRIFIGLVPVIALGIFAGVTYFVSYLYGAVGGYEPFIPISKNVYRLWESFFILPVYLATWAVLSIIAHSAGKKLQGTGTLKQSLNVLGYAYFVPLLFFAAADFLLIVPAYSWKTAALAGLYGPAIQTVLSIIDILYVAIPFGLFAPVYTYIAIKNIQKFSSRKALAITALSIIPASMMFAVIW